VHLGHRAVIGAAVDAARREGGMVAATGHEVLRPLWSGSKSMAAPHECFDGRLPPRMGRGL
jgi:hypothetical protein